jgi:hypothetical protein
MTESAFAKSIETAATATTPRRRFTAVLNRDGNDGFVKSEWQPASRCSLAAADDGVERGPSEISLLQQFPRTGFGMETPPVTKHHFRSLSLQTGDKISPLEANAMLVDMILADRDNAREGLSCRRRWRNESQMEALVPGDHAQGDESDLDNYHESVAPSKPLPPSAYDSSGAATEDDSDLDDETTSARLGKSKASAGAFSKGSCSGGLGNTSFPLPNDYHQAQAGDAEVPSASESHAAAIKEMLDQYHQLERETMMENIALRSPEAYKNALERVPKGNTTF